MPDQMKQYLLPPTENLLGLKVFTYQMKQGEIAERIAVEYLFTLFCYVFYHCAIIIG